MPIFDKATHVANLREVLPEEVLDVCEDHDLGIPGLDFPIGYETLESLPTLCVGQADDLKYESDGIRIWLSRCGIGDGEPYEEAASLEYLVNGCWQDGGRWDAELASSLDF